MPFWSKRPTFDAIYFIIKIRHFISNLHCQLGLSRLVRSALFYSANRDIAQLDSLMELESRGLISPCQVFTNPHSATSSSDKLFFFKFFRDHYGIKLFSFEGPFPNTNRATINELERANNEKRPCFSNDPVQRLPYWSNLGSKNLCENIKFYKPKGLTSSCVPNDVLADSLNKNSQKEKRELHPTNDRIEQRSFAYGFPAAQKECTLMETHGSASTSKKASFLKNTKAISANRHEQGFSKASRGSNCAHVASNAPRGNHTTVMKPIKYSQQNSAQNDVIKDR